MNDSQEYKQIDLLKLAGSLLRMWWLILLAAAVCAVGSFAYTKMFVTPQYRASVLMYVNNSSISIGGASVSISSGNISTARTLVDTYLVILKTRLTLEEVIEKADLDCSYGELHGMISAGAENGTEIFRVTVTNPDPETACRIANTIAEVLPEKISNVVAGSTVETVDLAVVPTTRSSPNYSRNTVLGAFVGTVLAAGVIILFELLNSKVRSEDWLLETFGEEIPLLAVIPDAAGGPKKKYGYGSYKSHYKYYGNYEQFDGNLDGKDEKDGGKQA